MKSQFLQTTGLEHPANSHIEKFECGRINCNQAAVGVFEVQNGNSICDVPLCEACAIKEKALTL
jgi:hypothetical protein